ncbi:acyl-CoA dehydratase activase [Desulfitibacter alkalitolerans]|uniref:acyl-CoA dehydratase activase n=1 Tax=Desulfitibacter alkalitolerans TaxID=264641 RepID=UPI0004841D9E|nr:acyl-CoA dehydratase activase [Desulfitibacter alkalitolerans]
MHGYLGIDVGSVSTNIVVIDDHNEVKHKLYIRTQGQPIKAVQKGLQKVKEEIGEDLTIMGVGTTGSARNLTALMVGADVVKNEITAHAVAASTLVPDAKTVIEIGGQDSKIIIIRNGVVADFAMNTVCAAGTGSFLDQQASRLELPIEEFGRMALHSNNPVRIAGRCSVFAESDMIHKQQMGHSLEDIVAGLCEALVRNYLNNVGKGKNIQSKIVFQGGVAANHGMIEAFKRELKCEVVVPEYHDVMGAIGSALLAKETTKGQSTKFKGFKSAMAQYQASSFECNSCANSCEVIQILEGEEVLARWGDRCGKWENGSMKREQIS